MDSLWRLAMWGLSAAAALMLDVLSTYSDTGSTRLLLAMNGSGNSGWALGWQIERIRSIPTSMQALLFLPGVRRISWLLLVGCLSIGGALYIRYFGIEQGQTSLACYSGLETTLCTAIRLVTILFKYSVFGWTAVLAAFLNLIRPSMLFFSIGLAAAGFGLVLHNTGLSGLAVGLLILSLARRAPATE
jgi:hypothetical protein